MDSTKIVTTLIGVVAIVGLVVWLVSSQGHSVEKVSVAGVDVTFTEVDQPSECSVEGTVRFEEVGLPVLSASEMLGRTEGGAFFRLAPVNGQSFSAVCTGVGQPFELIVGQGNGCRQRTGVTIPEEGNWRVDVAINLMEPTCV
jgi:hypothetical protein